MVRKEESLFFVVFLKFQVWREERKDPGIFFFSKMHLKHFLSGTGWRRTGPFHLCSKHRNRGARDAGVPSPPVS